MCIRTKQKSAANYKEMRVTGGGVANVQALTGVEKAISELLSPVVISGLNIPIPQPTWDVPESEAGPNTNPEVIFTKWL